MDEYNLSWQARLKRFIAECKRVIKITKKPTSQEFKVSVKVSGLGIIAIGMIGFVIQFLYNLIKGI